MITATQRLSVCGRLAKSIADGPSEVHLPGIAKLEARDHDPAGFLKYHDVPVR